MTTLTEDIKRMMNALAFAHAGENLTPSQKARHLDQAGGIEAAPLAASATPAQPRPERARQQVALYMGSELPADMMHYVIQTCARLKHRLAVLTFQSEHDARAVLNPYADTLAAAGIEMQVAVLSGDIVSGLAHYLRRHPEVAFLACNETGYLGRSFMNGSQRQDILPVPVVLVASHVNSAQNVGRAQPGQNLDSVRAA